MQEGGTTHFSRRVIWLVGLALLSIAAGAVMFRFEETLKGIPLLMLFLPMIIAAGGNSGGQASMVAIRAMALNELSGRDTLKVAWKELRLGAMLGLILGAAIDTPKKKYFFCQPKKKFFFYHLVISGFLPSFSMETSVRGPSLGFLGPNPMVSSNPTSVRSGRVGVVRWEELPVFWHLEPVTRDSG